LASFLKKFLMLLNPLIESQEPQGRWPHLLQALPAEFDVPSLQQIHMMWSDVGSVVGLVDWLGLS
jgi:hypothetical protein